MSTIIDLFRKTLRDKSEEHREKLVQEFLKDINTNLLELSRFIGGEFFPDTVIASTAAENVIAALATKVSRKQDKERETILKIIAPSEPIEGWRPLQVLLEELSFENYVTVIRTRFTPSSSFTAKKVVSRISRVAKGASPKIVDVTDANPLVVAGLCSGGVRRFVILVDIGYAAVYQHFSCA
ncbi:hypothetical protein PYJP_03090 [Pyrofollis japonicus]|uniref:hypothetical protein n=1 Tax=Pyrofollis japonicus TaxID=3060460 RepID=UPI00295B6CE5|nr:hypothetical protein [Pyrofollis japonicus]BEP16957.1 hypothetical protein PYJP_03090 [Pyrofollis japonicus]